VWNLGAAVGVAFGFGVGAALEVVFSSRQHYGWHPCWTEIVPFFRRRNGLA